MATDLIADARTKASNLMTQYGLVCEYEDARGWKTTTSCSVPRMTLDGELDRFGYTGPDKQWTMKVLTAAIGVEPKQNDVVDIPESSSAIHCGEWRVLRLLRNDNVECFLIVQKPT